jgi:hypothetical protein
MSSLTNLLVPLVFFFLLDRILKKHILVPCFIAAWCVLLLWVPSFDAFAEEAFERSVEFLNSFAAVGWNYTVASVLICVVAPGIVFIALLYYAFRNLFGKHTCAGETSCSSVSE